MLALLVSLFSVLGTASTVILTALRLPSETTAMVLDASTIDPKIDQTKRVLVVRALNGGGSSSLVRHADLDLTSVGAQVVELENMTPRDAEVPANGKTDLTFYASQVKPDSGKTKAAIASALCTGSVTLLLRVDERNRFGKLIPRDEPLKVENISGRQIRDWVLDKIAGDAEDCP